MDYQPAIVVHLASHHLEGEHESFNPGLALRLYRDRVFVTAGAYRNSLGRESVYAGGGYRYPVTERLSVGFLAGVVTGYQVSVAPALVPEVSYRVGDWDLMLNLIPPLHAGAVDVDAALGFSVGRRWR